MKFGKLKQSESLSQHPCRQFDSSACMLPKRNATTGGLLAKLQQASLVLCCLKCNGEKTVGSHDNSVASSHRC